MIEREAEVRSQREITAVFCLRKEVTMDQVRLWKW